MKMLKFGLSAFAAFAFSASVQAQTIGPGNGMGNAPGGYYQPPIIAGSQPDNQGFHAGGVAACDGCHVMHNASGGVAKSTIQAATSVAPWTNVTNAYLLQGSDQSSTCLICHSGAKAAGVQFTVADLTNTTTNTGVPTNYTPAGDFGWTRMDFAGANGAGGSAGVRHGHSVVAADFGMGADVMLTAPGGTWTAGAGRRSFACSSCHDPHGRYRMQTAATPNGIEFAGPFTGSPAVLPIAASGSYGAEPTATYAVGAYRLLGGQAYTPASNTTSPFANNPPVAVAPLTYNPVDGEATAEVRVAYGTGMSEWCQNCHTNIHLDNYTSGVAGLRHPAGSDAFLHAGQISVYNSYVSSGVVDTSATSKYTSLVPFEVGPNATIATLRGNATAAASIFADANSAVMCLSCHRAHASAFDSMVRWDPNATFLTDATAFTGGNTARSAGQSTAGYYNRPVGAGGGNAVGAYQRSLCNKCHGKD